MDKINHINWKQTLLDYHYLVQFLGAFGDANCEKQEDDSQSCLYYTHNGFYSNSTPHNYRLLLDVNTKKFLLIKDNDSKNEVSIHNKDQSAILKELNTIMSDNHLNSLKIRTYSDFPQHSVQNGYKYFEGLQTNNSIEYNFIHYLYQKIHDIFQSILEYWNCKLTIRIWPHHFDMAFLKIINKEKQTSIGVGFSPGDEHYELPYVYISPWPYPAKNTLPEIPQIAFWHTNLFTAAIIHLFPLFTHKKTPPNDIIEYHINKNVDFSDNVQNTIIEIVKALTNK